MKKAIYAISMMVLLLVVAVPVLAVDDADRTHLRGAGIAIDNENVSHKSGIWIALNTTDGYEVKRGFIFVIYGFHERGIYHLAADTWSVTVSEDKSTFTAEGKVVSDEVEYTASIEGEFLRDTKAGKIYLVTGNIVDSDGNIIVDLYYLAHVENLS